MDFSLQFMEPSNGFESMEIIGVTIDLQFHGERTYVQPYSEPFNSDVNEPIWVFVI